MNSSSITLVTGGAGFIGSELVIQLIKEGAKVIVYDNLSFGRRTNLPESNDIVFIEGDLRNSEKICKTIKTYKPSIVFHLAALHFIPYCIANPQETVQVNVEGTLNVLEGCKHDAVENVVYTSTAAVYPVKEEPHMETDSPGPIEIYGATKLFGEELVRLFHEETHKKCGVARLFNGYGRRETNAHVIPDILEQVPTGDEINLGNVDPQRDFIHTSDISRALRYIANNDRFVFDVFNVGTGVQRSVVDVVDTIAKLLGRPLKIKTEKARVRKVERMNLVPDISKIKRTLGWEPKMDLQGGFRDMLESEGLM